MLLHRKFVIILFIHSIISLYLYGLTDIYFIIWVMIDPIARGCDSQAALILGRDHVLFLRKLCALHDCNGEPWRKKSALSPVKKLEGREKERLRERGREGKERENKRKQLSVHRPVTGAPWCIRAEERRVTWPHSERGGASSVPSCCMLFTLYVPKAVLYAVSVGWGKEPQVWWSFIEETKLFWRMSAWVWKGWKGLPHFQSSTGERGLGRGTGPHFSPCFYISCYLTAVSLFWYYRQ